MIAHKVRQSDLDIVPEKIFLRNFVSLYKAKWIIPQVDYPSAVSIISLDSRPDSSFILGFPLSGSKGVQMAARSKGNLCRESETSRLSVDSQCDYPENTGQSISISKSIIISFSCPKIGLNFSGLCFWRQDKTTR